MRYEETYFAVDPLHLEVCEVDVLYPVSKKKVLVSDKDTGEHFEVTQVYSDYEQAVDALEDIMIADFPQGNPRVDIVTEIVVMVVTLALLLFLLF